MLIYLIDGNIYFDNLVMLVLAGFLYCKDTVLSYLINVLGRYFETMKICFSSDVYLLILTSMVELVCTYIAVLFA